MLPEHHPLQLAKRVATIDRLSGGRMFLGVGVGWMREELEALGIDPATRGSRTDEGIEALRAIWRDDEVTLQRHATSGSTACAAIPSRCRRTVPILVGGHSAGAARRAGRLGDGFFPLGLAGEQLDQRVAEVAAAAEAAGRDPAEVPLTLGGLLGEGARGGPGRGGAPRARSGSCCPPASTTSTSCAATWMPQWPPSPA